MEEINKQIEANKPLVVSIAKNYYNNGLSKEELEMYGVYGLWQALENFDKTLGYELSTYANRYIKSAIEEAIDEVKGVSIYQRKQINKIKKIETQLIQDLNRKPTDEELAGKSEVPIEKIKKLVRESQGTISLDDTINDENYFTVGDLVADESMSFDDQMIQAEEEIYNAKRDGLFLKKLFPHERVVFRLCIKQTNSNEDVGKKLDVNRERIRTIKNKVEVRYKSFLQSKEYEKFLRKKETSMLKEIVEKHKKQLGASAKDEKIMRYENYEDLSELDFDIIRERYKESNTFITDNKKRFASYFRYLCRKRGVTHVSFNRATGLCEKQFERYKAGTHDPGMRPIIAFGVYFKIDSGVIEDLLRRGGYVLSDTNKVHTAYRFLLRECSGYPREYCNKLLEFLGIKENHWL